MKNSINITKRLLPLLLAVLLLLASCGGGGGTETSAVPESTAEPAYELTPDGGWTLTRAEKAGDSVRDAAKAVRDAISARTGEAPQLGDDWLASGTSAPEHEIIIGSTARAESGTVWDALLPGEFTVRVIDGRIVCLGTNDELTVRAAEHLVSLIASGTKIYSDYSYTGRGDYPVTSLTLGGVPIGSFRIVTPAGIDLSAHAETLRASISALCGVSLTVSPASSGKTEHEIVLGCARSAAEDKSGYGDAAVRWQDGSLYLDCGSRATASAAVEYFLNKMIGSQSGDVALTPGEGETLYRLSVPAREEYIADPAKMPLVWENRRSADERLVSWDAKIATLMQTDKTRIFTVAHRADHMNYPENSVESIISVWAMGGDCVEIDVRFTKDGVAVIMHDDTLDRMTDVASKAGKNGLPTSTRVSDWTLAELRTLCLREGMGGTTPVTPYRIATLEEVLTVCRNRLFIICDKPTEWRYCELPQIMGGGKANYLFPIMQKTGNMTSILISYGTTGTDAKSTLSADDALKIQSYIYEQTGEKAFFYLRAWTTRSTAAPYARRLREKSLTNAAILVNGAFDPADQKKLSDISTLCAAYPDVMFGSWTIEDGTDKLSVWKTMYHAGERAMMTNNIEALVSYAAELLK